ncbi:hypothetical protein Pint_24932 [Pistacia integerrima]|uniref:Uncharacterized protein n=1 Tax=Pistacia integerrima TaxID=434235 RepID=A0ACC0YB23_9ROSI|nr:hypothetical protein Pint_24932 [Pistacia integerrima]
MAGPQCCANPPNLNAGSGVGHVEKLGGLSTYVTGSTHSKLGVLLVSDVYGYEAPNLRCGLLSFLSSAANSCDKGFDDAKPVIQDLKSKTKVVVQLAKCEFIQAAVMCHPSFVTPNDINGMSSSISRAIFLWVEVPIAILGAEIDQFSPPSLVKQFEEILTAKSEDKGYEDAKPVIAALKSKGVSAIGAAGFCWGGRVAVKLASTDYIQAAVLLHPSRIMVDDINEVKIPVAILGAEIDHITPAEQVKHFGEILSSKSEIDSLVKIFPGVSHGWTVKYKVEDESAVKSAEEAHEDMLNWFTKHVK